MGKGNQAGLKSIRHGKFQTKKRIIPLYERESQAHKIIKKAARGCLFTHDVNLGQISVTYPNGLIRLKLHEATNVFYRLSGYQIHPVIGIN